MFFISVNTLLKRRKHCIINVVGRRPTILGGYGGMPPQENFEKLKHFLHSRAKIEYFDE